MSRTLATFVCLALTTGAVVEAQAAPRRAPKANPYTLDILGFNDGDPYRLRGAAAEAVLAESGAQLWRFDSADWMDRSQRGRYVSVADVAARWPNRSASELVAVYQVDLDGDRVAEMLLMPDADALDDKKRYAPTILRRHKKRYKVVFEARKLPGERYGVVDIRDLNGDGTPELLLMGEAGRRGYYQFHELVGASGESFATLDVKHVDSVHYLDLDKDSKIEVVVRERVGRRGPAYQWTYIDHLYQWNGQQFVTAQERFPRYDDVQTLPTLLGDLIDHYRAKLPILMEKVGAIKRVRASTLSRVKTPPRFQRKVVRALAALQRDQLKSARRQLEELDRQYRYDTQVLLGLARLHADRAISGGKASAQRRHWESVLDYGIRTLTVDPQNRQAWWYVGVGFHQLHERSASVAALTHVVRLGGKSDEGVAFLKARRGEPGMDAGLQATIDQVLEELRD